MSLFGSINDYFAGNASGTADQAAAEIAAKQAQLKAQQDAKLANGDITADEYSAVLGSNYFQTSNDPNSIYSGLGIAGAGIGGAVDAAGNPIKVLQDGLAWEGSVAGSTVSGLASGIKGGVFGFLGKIPWWVYLVGAGALFLYLGGGGFLERKARARLSK